MSLPGFKALTDAEVVEVACEVMHDAYEKAAVGAGWETQEQSRKPWSEAPEPNKVTMRAAVTALLAHLARPAATTDTSAQATGADLIAAERRRQVEVEGWTEEHDVKHGPWTLMRAAQCYERGSDEWWPWDARWWKPKGPLRNLVRAGALYQAADDTAASILGPRDGVHRCAAAIDLLLAEVRSLDAATPTARHEESTS